MKGLIYKFVMAVGLLMASVTASATVTYVYTDPQGTPLAEADASGAITATFDYKPYGSQALGSPKAGPGYTGHVNDPDTGFVYMQARYYDPGVERFLGVDPPSPEMGNIFNFNRYDYTNNNPINHTDPDGRCADQLSGGPGSCGSMPSMSPEAAKTVVSLTPVAGDIVNVIDAVREPSVVNIVAAVIGVVPEIGPEAAKALKVGIEAEKTGAAAARAENIAKGMAEKQLGPSGKPLRHTVQHSTRKEAREAAEREAPRGGKARHDANPADSRQGAHFQAEDAKGDNVKPVVHHEYPER